MRKAIKSCKCEFGLFLIGGFLYNMIEICWRGYTHWTMFFVGGACFNVIGRIHTVGEKLGMFRRCALCSVAVSTIEFLSGCLVNLKWNMEVWDYSRIPLNLKGQICLLYSILWGFLSLVAMPVYRRCRAWLAGEEKVPLFSGIGALSERAGGPSSY